MIEYDLDTEHSIVHVRPKSAIEQDDFTKLANAVDPLIEATGDLAGLIIEASGFPGWERCVGVDQAFPGRAGRGSTTVDPQRRMVRLRDASAAG